jgi:hypothetical protein
MSVKYLKLLFFLIIVGCSKKSVQLPILEIDGIEDVIYNNSTIWLFFKNTDTIARLNKNNMISSTHWIFNIDKKLTLKQIIPIIKKLQLKREQPSMHKSIEPLHNYFSYINRSSQKLSLIKFDSVKYIIFRQLSTVYKQNTSEKQLNLFVKNTGLTINNTNISLNNLKEDLKNLFKPTKISLHLHLDKNLTYQNYLNLKAVLNNIVSDSISINKNESINFTF